MATSDTIPFLIHILPTKKPRTEKTHFNQVKYKVKSIKQEKGSCYIDKNTINVEF
jgi:hypothetical protein